MAGQVSVLFSNPLGSFGFVKAGRLRPIAVSGSRRIAAMPDVPTVAESGVPGYEAASWYGVLAPARTPQAIVATLNREIAAIARMSDVRERLGADGAEAIGSSPAEFAAHIRRELARWARVIEAAHIPRT